MMGTELVSNATTRDADLLRRMTNTWEILLPGIVNDESLPYFREFLAREALRHDPTQ